MFQQFFCKHKSSLKLKVYLKKYSPSILSQYAADCPNDSKHLITQKKKISIKAYKPLNYWQKAGFFFFSVLGNFLPELYIVYNNHLKRCLWVITGSELVYDLQCFSTD